MNNRILIIPPHKWYMEAQAEYLIRYLSDEFFMEVAPIPYPPYKNFLDRFPNESPLARSPDDYDLLWPLWPRHAGVDPDVYHNKMVTVFYEPLEGRYQDYAAVGVTTPIAEQLMGDFHYHSLRFGVDTELFKPFPMVREDDLFHVGMVGSYGNPRHMFKPVLEALQGLTGVRLMFFPQNWVNKGGDVSQVGGTEFLKRVVASEKWWPGLPNVYNRLDVLIRCEQDPGHSFPVLEAAACGVPVIATNAGIDKCITDIGGGILITGDRIQHMTLPQNTALEIRKAIEYLKNNRDVAKGMGMNGRKEIERNWTWEKHIPAWRNFFREGLVHAASHHL